MLIDKVNEKQRELESDLQNSVTSSFDERISRLTQEQKTDYENKHKISYTISLCVGIICLIIVAIVAIVLNVSKSVQGDMDLLIFAIVAMIFFFVCSVIGFMSFIKLRKRSKQDIYNSYVKDEDKQFIAKNKIDIPKKAQDIVINDYFNSIGFSYTQSIPIIAAEGKWQFIFINSQTKQFKYLNLETDADVTVDFDSIVSYQIFEDSKEIVKSKSGDVLLGGLLFGVTGMLMAQNSQKEIERPVTSLKLVIRFNDFSQPQLTISFIDNNLPTYIKDYKSTLNSIYENLRLIYSNLEIIKRNGSQSVELSEIDKF
ncbi:MAG: hypothetical protein HDT36_00550 [Clostridiales bacterium]|nr:hypothetical protein [Clostridiales bacterium]